MQNNHVIVLGAGIVGICCALAIQRRGRKVILLDRSGPATETSSGNAGVICNSGIHPLASPQLLLKAPVLLANRDPRFYMPYSELPRLAPWLWHFAGNCTGKKFRQGTKLLTYLTRDALPRHLALMSEAGVSKLLQDSGWLQVLRTEKSYRLALANIKSYEQAGLEATAMNPEQLTRFEPDLGHIYSGAIWLQDTHSVSDPAALCNGYFDLFVKSGGTFHSQTATRLQRNSNYWQVDTDSKSYFTEKLVVATGAWSKPLLKTIGITLPFVIERGYHMMFDYPSGKQLGRSVLDSDLGYVITPMQQGLRATTASNLVSRELKPDPRQLYTLLPEMQRTFEMGKQQLSKPWMGRRTTTADSLPLIGPLHRHPGLFIATGHCHLGLTLGPITGELIADEVFDTPDPACKSFYPDRHI